MQKKVCGKKTNSRDPSFHKYEPFIPQPIDEPATEDELEIKPAS